MSDTGFRKYVTNQLAIVRGKLFSPQAFRLAVHDQENT